MTSGSLDNASSVPVNLEDLADVIEAARNLLSIRRPIAFRLVDHEEMIDLNTRFRNIHESTDVLTFPSGLDDPLPLGDIAICVPYALDQAHQRGATLDHELSALAIHGCLHLLGYDDETDDDRRTMQIKMNEVGEKLGIPIEAEWTSVLHQAPETGQFDQ